MANPKRKRQPVPPLVRQAPGVPAARVATPPQLPGPVDQEEALLALRRLALRRAQVERDLAVALDGALAAGASYAAVAAAVGVTRQSIRERVLRRA